VKERVKRVVRGSATDKELTAREKMTTRNEQSVGEVMTTGSENRYNSFDETLQRNVFTHTAPLSWILKVAFLAGPGCPVRRWWVPSPGRDASFIRQLVPPLTRLANELFYKSHIYLTSRPVT
jgi:hypothetical protein